MTNRPGLDAPRIDQGQESPEKEMKTVRQFSRLGPCAMLGPIVRETRTRIYFRSREGQEAFVSKSSPSPSTPSRARHAAIMRARNVPTAIGTERRASCSSQSRMTA